MTTISTGYSSLTGQSASSSSSNDIIPPLAQTLAIGTPAEQQDYSYTLDLSPGALAYIQELNAQAAENPSAQPFRANAITGFALTPNQQRTLDDILAKYQDAPFTQETFNLIQDDMNAAGLTAEVFAAQDKARNHNPTLFFFEALSGGANMALDNATGNASEPSDETDTKMMNFMKSVVASWATLSTTVDEATPVIES